MREIDCYSLLLQRGMPVASQNVWVVGAWHAYLLTFLDVSQFQAS